MNTVPMNSPGFVAADRLKWRESRLPTAASDACREMLRRSLAFVPGLAVAVAVYSLIHATGMTEPLTALAGTAALVYLGTAAVAGNTIRALLDLAAAAIAFSAALYATDISGLAAAFLIHGLWGTVRSALEPTDSRAFFSNWTAFASAMALLVLLGS